MLYFKQSQKLVSTQLASIIFFLFININIYKQEKNNRCILRADQFYIYILYITATDTLLSMKSLLPIAKDIFQSLSISCGVIISVRFRSILRN